MSLDKQKILSYSQRTENLLSGLHCHRETGQAFISAQKTADCILKPSNISKCCPLFSCLLIIQFVYWLEYIGEGKGPDEWYYMMNRYDIKRIVFRKWSNDIKMSLGRLCVSRTGWILRASHSVNLALIPENTQMSPSGFIHLSSVNPKSSPSHILLFHYPHSSPLSILLGVWG